MQTINPMGFTASPAMLREELASAPTRIKQSLSSWLDSRNDFYTKVAGYAVTRRAAVLYGVVLPAMVVCAIVFAEAAPALSFALVALAGCIVRRHSSHDSEEESAE